MKCDGMKRGKGREEGCNKEGRVWNEEEGDNKRVGGMEGKRGRNKGRMEGRERIRKGLIGGINGLMKKWKKEELNKRKKDGRKK